MFNTFPAVASLAGFVASHGEKRSPGPDESGLRYGGTKEEWAKLSAHLRDRVQVHFRSEELDVIDQFILLASQGSVFDHLCR